MRRSNMGKQMMPGMMMQNQDAPTPPGGAMLKPGKGPAGRPGAKKGVPNFKSRISKPGGMARGGDVKAAGDMPIAGTEAMRDVVRDMRRRGEKYAKGGGIGHMGDMPNKMAEGGGVGARSNTKGAMQEAEQRAAMMRRGLEADNAERARTGGDRKEGYAKGGGVGCAPRKMKTGGAVMAGQGSGIGRLKRSK